MLSEEVIGKITRRGVQEIISHDEFVRMLQEGKPLRLKMGFDPSRPPGLRTGSPSSLWLTST